jgi:hypothetical protein
MFMISLLDENQPGLRHKFTIGIQSVRLEKKQPASNEKAKNAPLFLRHSDRDSGKKHAPARN